MTTRFLLLTLPLFLGLASFSAAEEVLATGKFTGTSDHETSGGVKVVKNKTGFAVVLGEDFSLDGAPTPRVGLGKDGKYQKATDSGKLAKLKGEQTYQLPDGIDPKDFTDVFIWCEKFSVPLGVAKLNKSN